MAAASLEILWRHAPAKTAFWEGAGAGELGVQDWWLKGSGGGYAGLGGNQL